MPSLGSTWKRRDNNGHRLQRLSNRLMELLSEIPKAKRKELVQAGTKLYKSGITPTAPAAPDAHLTRAQQRQTLRALGYRGSKAKRHNIDRQKAKFQQVLAVEQVLDHVEDRINHPVRSRLRRK